MVWLGLVYFGGKGLLYSGVRVCCISGVGNEGWWFSRLGWFGLAVFEAGVVWIGGFRGWDD